MVITEVEVFPVEVVSAAVVPVEEEVVPAAVVAAERRVG